jgi:hypothetical protein
MITDLRKGLAEIGLHLRHGHGAGAAAAALIEAKNLNPEQAADRCHYADFVLAPMLLGDQEHVEIRPQRAAEAHDTMSASGPRRLWIVRTFERSPVPDTSQTQTV